MLDMPVCFIHYESSYISHAASLISTMMTNLVAPPFSKVYSEIAPADMISPARWLAKDSNG